MRHAAWIGFVFLGCSAAVSPDPSSPDAPGEDANPSSASGAKAFACAPAERTGSVRVEMEAKNKWVLVDAHGQDQSQDIGETAAVYVLSPAATAAGTSRALVRLEAFTPGTKIAENQNAWESAVTAGWTKEQEGLYVERAGDGSWCWSGSNGCDASDAKRTAFADSVGKTADLLDLAADLSPSLEGLANDGGLSLPLPGSVMKKIGASDDSAVARSDKPGYPATFVASRAWDRVTQMTSKSPDGSETKIPKNQHVETSVVFTVDRQCKVLELARTDSSFIRLYDTLPSGTGFVRTIHWRFTPMGT